MEASNPVYSYVFLGLLGIFFASGFLYTIPLLYLYFGARFDDLSKEQIKKLLAIFGIGTVLMFTSATAFILLGLFQEKVIPSFVWLIIFVMVVGAALLLVIYTYSLFLMMRWSYNYLDKYRQQKRK